MDNVKGKSIIIIEWTKCRNPYNRVENKHQISVKAYKTKEVQYKQASSAQLYMW